MYMYIYMYLCMYMCLYVCMCIYIYIYIVYLHICIIYIYIHIYIYIYIIYVYIYIYTYYRTASSGSPPRGGSGPASGCWSSPVKDKKACNISNIWDVYFNVEVTDRNMLQAVLSFPDAGVLLLGAKDCRPEIDTSEIIVDLQWHFPMDFQWHFPTEFHFCEFRCVIFRPDPGARSRAPSPGASSRGRRGRRRATPWTSGPGGCRGTRRRGSAPFCLLPLQNTRRYSNIRQKLSKHIIVNRSQSKSSRGTRRRGFSASAVSPRPGLPRNLSLTKLSRCAALSCTILYYTILCYTILYYTIYIYIYKITVTIIVHIRV